jgi:tol-pal system protein YbgF
MHFQFVRAAWVLGGALCLSGCGGVQLEGRVRALSKQVAELSRLHKESLSRQEDLENRLLLLSDQIESLQVARGRRGAVDLPVLSLRPEPRPPQGVSLAQGTPLLQGTRDNVPVEFSGPARSEEPDRVRPYLRAEGEYAAVTAAPEVQGAEPEVRRGRRPRTPPPAPSPLPSPGSIENLGVVPVPRLQTDGRPPSPSGRGAGGEGITGTASAEAAAPPPVKATTDSGEATILYRTAYDHLRGGRYLEAERDLREFVRRFPRHDYADNAQYWLGETFYARKTYHDAATAFRAVVERWPTGNKAPDALLKLGYSLLMLGERDKGQKVLSQVLSHYPNTEAARLADKRLKEGK